MDAIRMETLNQAARLCALAGRGETTAIVERTAQALALSTGRTYALITKTRQALGLAQPRQRRSDAGASAMSTEELRLIGGVIAKGDRNGKRMLGTQDAVEMLAADGKIAAPLSASRVARLLRQSGHHPDQLNAPRPSVRMRVDRINEVAQMDASTSVLYKTPKGEMLLLQEGVHYKNKPENLIRVLPDLLTRWVLTEYGSGSIAARFYRGGETTENALDFLMWAMTQRFDAQGRAMPFHGVFDMLYTDQGAWAKSGLFKNFCSTMDIKHVAHAAYNSQATGQVENAQNLVERGFESRLRFMDPASITIDRLNAAVELWMHAYNGTRKHRRHKMARYAAWSLIQSEELRMAPPLEVMKALPATVAQKRQVRSDMTVSFAFKDMGSQDYNLRYVPNISPKDEVFVTVNPFQLPAVRVGVTDRDTGEIVWHQVEPVQTNRLGFDVNAPHLNGSDYKALRATPADENRKAIAAQAFAVDGKPATVAQAEAAQRKNATPYLGQFDPLADIKAAQVPTYLQRPGTPHGAAAPTLEPVRLSVAEACKRMKLALGELYDPNTYAWLTERHGAAGVPEDTVAGLIASRRQPASAAPAGGLRAVGGGS